MRQHKILAVEDDEHIARLIKYNTEKEGYICQTVESGEDGLEIIRRERVDLVILDVMLPRMTGLSVCKAIKQDKQLASIPVIMLTAKGEEIDKIIGFESGADDYLVKPFSPRVLSARVKAILRRGKDRYIESGATVRVDDLLINPARHEVKLREKLIDLTSTEFKMLHFLARQRGLVFTRYKIVDAVHGEDYPVTDRSVDVQVVGLRKKLGEYGPYIETVRGVGYRFRG